MGRHSAREKAMIGLFQIEFHYEDKNWIAKFLEQYGSSEDESFEKELIEESITCWDTNNRLIEEHLKKGWTIERLGAMERSILRLGVTELKSDLETPMEVVLNENIELAKKYCNEESPVFINGILHQIQIDMKNNKEKQTDE
jgi:N utilization substance protein B